MNYDSISDVTLNRVKLSADLYNVKLKQSTNPNDAQLPNASNTRNLTSYKASNLTEDEWKEKIVNLAKKDAKTKHMWSKETLQLRDDYVATAAPKINIINIIRKTILSGELGNTVSYNGQPIACYSSVFGWERVNTPAESARSHDFGAVYGDTYKAEVARINAEQSGAAGSQFTNNTFSVKV